MENSDLNTKLLDTAIRTMERNRALLFAINLIAALVLVVVYLENYGFDDEQREAHLIAYQERCNLLNQSLVKVPNWEKVSPQKQSDFSVCADLTAIRNFVITNSVLAFRMSDLTNPNGLVVKLRDSQDPISQYLRTQFSQETLQTLQEHNDNSELSETLHKALINELNKLLKDSLLFNETRFAQLNLSEDAQRLILQKPNCDEPMCDESQRLELARLNRVLLAEAYPAELTKSFTSEKSRNDTLTAIGKNLFKLNIIENEMKTAKLDTANVFPLGFGLPVPRNDLVIICGVLLVILYAWLAFSFTQHARITEKIKRLFRTSKREDENKTEASINEIIELNFLFHTSKGWVTALFVRALYFAAPVAMTIANLNDLFPDAPRGYAEYINDKWKVPYLVEILIMLILWGIGIIIFRTDKRANLEPATPAKAEDSTNVVGKVVLDKPNYEQKESRTWRVAAVSNRTYIIALLFACIFIASTAILLGGGSGVYHLTSDASIWVIITVVISAIGTISTAILGWRKDRREVREQEHQIMQLKQELAAIREKPVLPAPRETHE